MTVVFVTHPSHRLEQYYGPRALDALQALAQVRLNPEPRELATGELIEAAAGCDALIAYRQTAGPRELFERLPQLAAFIRCAVDIRTVDVTAASDHGVLVTQASAGYVAAVSEWIAGTMIDLARGISGYVNAYRSGQSPAPAMGMQLRGSTVGIIGYGQIGADFAQLALGLGMKVLVHTPQTVPPREGMDQVEMPALLASADFVVCLAPANVQTEKLMNAGTFAAMRRGAFFINASRGELVDEAALLAALDSGHLGGCALDVGRAPDQMPSPALARHPLVVATPHIGGLTPPAIEHQAMETVAQLGQLLRGQMPVGAVNAEHALRLRRWHQAATGASA
jgi:D-3-phosphoglycerate dehydrogenase